jgi:hypothetical protein
MICPEGHCPGCCFGSSRRACPARAVSNFRVYWTGTHGTVLTVTTKSVQALKRAEGRQRMADLRHARRSRRAALAFERRYALTYGMKGRITNLRQMLEAMAQ